MSFSQQVKNELCKNALPACCFRARLYGIVLFAGTLSPSKVRLKTESAALLSHAFSLIQTVCGVTPAAEGPGRGGYYRLSVTEPADVERLCSALGIAFAGPARRIRYGLLEGECCRAAFLGGVFLSCGSVTDPARSYHLEFETPHFSLSDDLCALLADFGLTSKLSVRKSCRVLYYKESEQIEDLLTVLGAVGAAFALMDAKIVKDIRNNVNRLTNCETANISKTVEASGAQLASIRRVMERGLGTLPDSLRKVAELRLANPDLSLSEIGKLLDPPLTKSGVSHRLKRIMEIAEGDG